VTTTDVSRRAVLAGGAVLAGATALAACSSSSPTTPSQTAPSGGSAGPSGAAAGTGGRGLATLADIPVGSAVSATTPDGKPVIVARPSADTAAAFSAVCTHQGCTVAPAGAELHCPCHGSVYNATTGAVIHGPAPKALPPLAVTVQNGQVVPA
jgi:Rieske Fe-S protein